MFRPFEYNDQIAEKKRLQTKQIPAELWMMDRKKTQINKPIDTVTYRRDTLNIHLCQDFFVVHSKLAALWLALLFVAGVTLSSLSLHAVFFQYAFCLSLFLSFFPRHIRNCLCVDKIVVDDIQICPNRVHNAPIVLLDSKTLKKTTDRRTEKYCI